MSKVIRMCFRNELITTRKTSKSLGQEGTKILVRNVPFQANKNELNEIFRYVLITRIFEAVL